MTEVNLRPLTMSERDTPVLFPSSITLPTYPTSGRVQLREPHMPSTLSFTQSMSERSLTVPSYELSMKVGTMEHSPITAKAKALTDEKPPEDTPAMPIPPKPPHSAARVKTATIIAPRQTTTAATLLVLSKQEKEPPQQASRAPTFDHTTHDWPTLHPRNNPVSLLGDNRDIKATPPHVRAILWPYLRSTDNPRTVKTNSVATLERPRGRMQDRSSPRWPHEAKELGPNELPSPRSTDTQTPTTNPRSKKCILLPPNSQTQPTTVEEQ